MARAARYASQHSGCAPPWTHREGELVIPMPMDVALLIRRQIRHRNAQEPGQFTLRGFGRVVVWRQSEPTAQELAGKTGGAQPVLERTLFDLMAGALLAAARALPIAYRYSPKPPELTRTVDKLAELYEENPLVVANLILDREAESLRLFSDAFRLRDGD